MNLKHFAPIRVLSSVFSNTALRTAAISTALLTISATVYAAHHGIDKEVFAIQKAKVSLIQAVSTAEHHVNGKAISAEFDHTRQGWVYEVEVVSGTKVFDITIDADKGSVISSEEDLPDHDARHTQRGAGTGT